ncbi:uncharacterized protein [Dermacentor albipictus]|uniref:uncharacterized protein isoform X1 n=1 Tax=Dermacentor albipictus TaxID=60249 RepID=UPI0038FCC2A6
MPPRRKAAVDAEERKRKRAEAARARRASESADARAARLAKARASHAKKTGEAREARLAQMRAYRARQERRDVPQRLDVLERNRVAQHRRVAAETSEKYNERLLRCRAAKQIRWASMSEEERQAELAHRRELQRTRYLLMPARERAHLLDRMRTAARARRAAATSNADPAAPRTARCVVPVCHSRSAPSSILYPLPAEPSQRQAWIDFVRGCPCGDACDWNPPTNEISFVCSLHFTVRCFRFQQPRGGSAGYRKRLKRGAVPTLYPIEEQCSSTANKNAPDGTAERLVHLDHLNMSHLHVSALLSEIRPRSFFTAQLLGASSRIQHWLPLPSKMQKGGHAIHWLPASQLQHKIKDTVLVTRMQCGSWHVLQRSNSSFPETSPPSVA